MTKSTGVGRGGKRAGAGRKPLPPAPKPPDPDIVQFAHMTTEELMEFGMRQEAANGRYDVMSKIGARLEAIRARKGRPATPAGKKAAAVETARTASARGGKFATPTPPGGQRPN